MSGVSTILGSGDDSWPGPGGSNDGNDTVVGGSANDQRLRGGEGNDSLVGGNGGSNGNSGPTYFSALLYGDAGDDTLVAGSGNVLWLGQNQALLSGLGNDSLNASSSNGDLLSGDIGNDTLVAGNGNDQYLDGGGDDDSLVGGSGGDNVNDYIGLGQQLQGGPLCPEGRTQGGGLGAKGTLAEAPREGSLQEAEAPYAGAHWMEAASSCLA